MVVKKMDPRVKRKWLNWLRSGMYSRTKNVLCKETRTGNCSFCCLGVLSNIHAEETGGHWTETEREKGEAWKGILTYGERETMPPKIVLLWAGLKIATAMILAQMNDDGETFDAFGKKSAGSFGVWNLSTLTSRGSRADTPSANSSDISARVCDFIDGR